MNVVDNALPNWIWDKGIFVEFIVMMVWARLEPCADQAFQYR
jgi:hypothetical protein